jgi:hypothetical protein
MPYEEQIIIMKMKPLQLNQDIELLRQYNTHAETLAEIYIKKLHRVFFLTKLYCTPRPTTH